MWCLSMQLYQIDCSALISRLHPWFWPKNSSTANSVKQQVESSVFARRLGQYDCRAYTSGFALQTALCSCPWLSKNFATVRHVGPATQYIPQNRHQFHPESPRCGLRVMDYWCSGLECIFGSERSKDRSIAVVKGFCKPAIATKR